MRIFLIILRIGVVMLALGGVGGAGFVTYLTWDNFISKADVHKGNVRDLKAIEVLTKSPTAPVLAKDIARQNESKVKEQVEKERPRYRMFPFLIAAAALSLLGSLFAMLGRTTAAGVLLLLGPVGPAVIAPLTLIFTFPLILAGLLAFFVSFLAWVTRPKSAPADEDEGPPKSKARPKDTSDLEDEEPIRPGKRKPGLKEEEDDELPKPKKGKGPVAEDEDEEPIPARSKRKRD